MAVPSSIEYFSDEMDSEEESLRQDEPRWIQRHSAKRLSKWIANNHTEAAVTTESSLEELQARKRLGLPADTNTKHQKRYRRLLKKTGNRSFLAPLVQPLNENRLVDGKIKKAGLQLPLLIDPSSISSQFEDLVLPSEFPNVTKMGARLEQKQQLVQSLDMISTSLVAACLNRTTVAWKILVRAIQPALGNSVEEILDTDEKFSAWAETMAAALSTIHHEIATMDAVFSLDRKSDPKLHQQRMLFVHQTRMREYPTVDRSVVFDCHLYEDQKRKTLHKPLTEADVVKHQKAEVKRLALVYMKADKNFLGEKKGRKRPFNNQRNTGNNEQTSNTNPNPKKKQKRKRK